MRVTFPHMGSAWVGIRYLLTEIGFEVIVPPPISRATLARGAKYSPEMICLPFKVMIGNYLEAVDLGAETIFMLGGIGPCRLGYYAEVQREILQDLGLPVQMIVLERSNFVQEIGQAARRMGKRISWVKLLPLVRFALAKVTYLDQLENCLLEKRYLEKEQGSCSRLFAHIMRRVDAAATWRELSSIRQETNLRLPQLLRPEADKPLRIGFIGEIYMLIENGVNFHLGERLGNLGAAVTRNLHGSSWVKEHLLTDGRALLNRMSLKHNCRPYLAQSVGGHCFETIGYAVRYAKEGYDGLLQVLPLTCMPEIIAESILPTIGRDYGIPLMTITLDEHAGEAGVLTRLEAFVDMLGNRRDADVGEGGKIFAFDLRR